MNIRTGVVLGVEFKNLYLAYFVKLKYIKKKLLHFLKSTSYI